MLYPPFVPTVMSQTCRNRFALDEPATATEAFTGSFERPVNLLAERNNAGTSKDKSKKQAHFPYSKRFNWHIPRVLNQACYLLCVRVFKNLTDKSSIIFKVTRIPSFNIYPFVQGEGVSRNSILNLCALFSQSGEQRKWNRRSVVQVTMNSHRR